MSEYTEGWKIRRGCQSTYFIELGNEVGIVVVFTDNAKKTEEIAQLLLAAPDLVEACEFGLRWMTCDDPQQTPNLPPAAAVEEILQAALSKAQPKQSVEKER